MSKRKSAKELQDAIDKSIKDLETAPAPKPSEPAPSEPIPSEPAPSEPSPSEPVPSEPAPSPAPAPAPAATTKPDEIPFKKQYVESQREGIVLHSKVEKFTGAIDQALNAPEPTDEEMRAIHTNWEMMDDDMRMLAKDNFKNKRALAGLAAVNKAEKDILAWNNNVDTFADDPKTVVTYPDLDGKIDDFKLFASKPTRRGVDFDTLVSAFLHDASKALKIKPKGQMFPTGVKGPKDPIKVASDKISHEAGVALKSSNYKEYRRLLVAGKIEPPVLE